MSAPCDEHPSGSAASPRACVFAPSPLLTVTVESGPSDGSEVHLHAGGQGFWIARMLVALGLDTDLCAPLGGEVGLVLQTLIAAEGVHVRVGTATRGNGAYVHDRRGGEREVVADMPPDVLSRHEVDELYSSTLAAGLAAALARGEDMATALRLGAAAGASNVTRRGLATGQREVVSQLAEHIDVRPLDLTRR